MAKANKGKGLKKGGLRTSLRQRFGVRLPEGTNIPVNLIQRAAKLGGKIGQQANLALTFRKIRARRQR